MSGSKIFCVDDNAANLKLLKMSLKQFDCELFESAAAMFERLDQQLPDVVLLDVMMPGLDGIEACKMIRARDDEIYIPVIFVSAKYEIQDKLRGYEAGGDDYISKPFDQHEIKAKVEATLKHKHDLDASREVAKTTRELLTGLNEISYVVNFLQQALSTTAVEQVAGFFLETLKAYGLNALIKINFEDQFQVFSTDGKANAMEDSVIDYVKNKGRLVSFGSKVSLNYPHISVIIRDMPDDENLRGRLRDHLALITKGADARIASMEKEKQARDRFNMLIEFMSELKLLLGRLDGSYEDYKKFTEDMLEKLTDELEENFMHMGLTEAQEETLLSISKAVETAISDKHNEFAGVHRQFSSMHRQMDAVLLHTLSKVNDDLNTTEAPDEMVVLF